MDNLFKYLHLLNEARSIDKGDHELYLRQQKVCDAIEKALGIQECSEDTPKFDNRGIPIVCNNYTTNNYRESDTSKALEEISKNITCDYRGLI